MITIHDYTECPKEPTERDINCMRLHGIVDNAIKMTQEFLHTLELARTGNVRIYCNHYLRKRAEAIKAGLERKLIEQPQAEFSFELHVNKPYVIHLFGDKTLSNKINWSDTAILLKEKIESYCTPSLKLNVDIIISTYDEGCEKVGSTGVLVGGISCKSEQHDSYIKNARYIKIAINSICRKLSSYVFVDEAQQRDKSHSGGLITKDNIEEMKKKYIKHDDNCMCGMCASEWTPQEGLQSTMHNNFCRDENGQLVREKADATPREFTLTLFISRKFIKAYCHDKTMFDLISQATMETRLAELINKEYDLSIALSVSVSILDSYNKMCYFIGDPNGLDEETYYRLEQIVNRILESGDLFDSFSDSQKASIEQTVSLNTNTHTICGSLAITNKDRYIGKPISSPTSFVTFEEYRNKFGDAAPGKAIEFDFDNSTSNTYAPTSLNNPTVSKEFVSELEDKVRAIPKGDEIREGVLTVIKDWKTLKENKAPLKTENMVVDESRRALAWAARDQYKVNADVKQIMTKAASSLNRDNPYRLMFCAPPKELHATRIFITAANYKTLLGDGVVAFQPRSEDIAEK